MMKDLKKKINELKVGESLQISPTFKVTCKSFLPDIDRSCSICAFENATIEFCAKVNCHTSAQGIPVYYQGFNYASLVGKINHLEAGESCNFSEKIKIQALVTEKHDMHPCAKCFFENSEACNHIECLNTDMIFIAKLKE